MDTGCSALVSDLDDLKLTLKNPRDDVDDESNDSHDCFDREELLAVAEEGLGPDVLKLRLKNARDDDDNDSNSDSDDGCDGAELLAAAEEGLGPDVLLSILVKNPGLIRTGDTVGNTVLHMAARDGHILTVCRLIAFLEEQQDEDLKTVFMDGNVDGDTALHLALKNRHREIAYCLIKAEEGTRDVCNNDRKYPCHLAYEAGFSEVHQLTCFIPELRMGRVDVEMRVRKEDLMVTNRSVAVRWIDLYDAINKGDVDALITGLTRGGVELLQHQDSRGQTLLHASVKASGRGHLQKLVRFMISNCATDAACLADKNGDTALHLAVQFKDLNASNCLIKAEPNTVYQVNHKGVSPLYMAVKAGNHELVKCMVSYCYLRDRASEILSYPKHATLAHLAIKAKSFGIFKVLMEHLPKFVKVKNENGVRLLSYAAIKGALDEVNYILTNFPKFAEKYDKDGSLPIHKAVGGGHVSIVEAFLKHYPQALHHVSKNGRNVLHIAAIDHKTEIITYLTEKLKMNKSSLNLKDNKGNARSTSTSSLHRIHSALVSDLDDLKLTLKNPRDDYDDESNDSHDGFDGEELLAVAEEGLGPDVLKLPLKNARDDDDNDSNSDSDDGWDGAELLAAAEEGLGQDVLLPILVKNPGLIRTGDAVGNTVLHMAARDGDIGTVCKLIAFLEERQDEDLKMVFMDGNVDGDTALHLALKNRHREVAYCLIKAEKGTRNVCNNDWKYPCDFAYEAGFSEENQLICFLPELHLRIGRVDGEIQASKEDLMVTNRSVAVRWIDLYQAINKGDVDALITGLTRGGVELLQHQDSQGETLLHASVKASGGAHLRKLVRFMKSNGVTDAARLPNENGDTALHLAVQFEDLNASNCLIKAEPKTVYQVNHKGVSPLYMAVKAGNHELVKCMVSYCCLRDRASEILSHPKHATLAHLAIKAKSFWILKLLMEHLPQLIKVRDEKGWRPLSYTANKGSLDEVTYFLTNFPKFAEKSDNDGSFPIHKAVGGGHVSIVEAFLKHCPQSLHHVDRKGRTILHIAVCYGRDDIITYLTNKVKLDDSFLNQRDYEGQSFMDYAKGPQQ